MRKIYHFKALCVSWLKWQKKKQGTSRWQFHCPKHWKYDNQWIVKWHTWRFATMHLITYHPAKFKLCCCWLQAARAALMLSIFMAEFMTLLASLLLCANTKTQASLRHQPSLLRTRAAATKAEILFCISMTGAPFFTFIARPKKTQTNMEMFFRT